MYTADYIIHIPRSSVACNVQAVHITLGKHLQRIFVTIKAPQLATNCIENTPDYGLLECRLYSQPSRIRSVQKHFYLILKHMLSGKGLKPRPLLRRPGEVSLYVLWNQQL